MPFSCESLTQHTHM